MGDATSYSMFMCTWSKKYRSLQDEFPSDDEPEAALKLPRGVFQVVLPASEKVQRQGLVPARFVFKQQDLRFLKSKLLPSSSETINVLASPD